MFTITNQKLALLQKLQHYILKNNSEWKAVKKQASIANVWFTQDFIDQAINNICAEFLQEEKLRNWLSNYTPVTTPKTIGLVMAGNIPLVGFHDFLCGFLSNHKLTIKASSKDEVLIKHIAAKLMEWDTTLDPEIKFSELLKNCDAYIATGSNNSGRYFEYYFSKYPHIIRKNKTSVAVLTGTETADELQDLSTDIQLYFGQGCRNVTHLLVPQQYNFEPLIKALNNYDDLIENHKYKNNYDYQLAILLLNKKYYMTNGSVILTEQDSLFAPISVVHFSYYNSKNDLVDKLCNADIQCVIGSDYIPFGKAQQPSLSTYADGIDTMSFLCSV